MTGLKFPAIAVWVLVLLATLAGGCTRPLEKLAAKVAVTPEPTATLAPGWKRFENKGVSLALPDTFAGGDLTAADQQTMIENLKDLGDDFAKYAEMMKQNPDVYILYLVDTVPTETGAFANVNVAREKGRSTIDLNTYAGAVKKQLPASFKVKSQNDLTLSGEPAKQIILEATIADTDINEVMYLIKRGDYVYAVTFATDSGTFEDKLPIFEQSIETFTVEP